MQLQLEVRFFSRARAALLRAVTASRGFREEEAVHCLACKVGLASNVVLATALLTRYARRGLLAPAQRLFDGMPYRDAVASNAMLTALCAAGRAADARKLFDGMPDRTPASWNTMVTCCCRAGDVALAREVFDACLRASSSTVVSWNAMIDGYCKAGTMDAALELFDRMDSSLRDIVTWNTMMAGYLHGDDPAAAISTFSRLMRAQRREPRLRPTMVTMATAVTACTQAGDFALGRRIHLHIRRRWPAGIDAVLSQALIDMYFKYGSVDRALEVFRVMHAGASLFCWNTVIAGLGRNGRGEDAVAAFRDMAAAVRPDAVTFVALLSACSHSGLEDDGARLFAEMRPVHGVEPGVEHYGCVVDLLCRASRLDEAVRVVRAMPMRPNAKVLGCLLLHARSSEQAEDNLRVAQWAAERIAELDPHDGAGYGLSNVYASLERWSHVEEHKSKSIRHGGDTRDVHAPQAARSDQV